MGMTWLRVGGLLVVEKFEDFVFLACKQVSIEYVRILVH